MARRRVVVTGLGLIAPVGLDAPTGWANVVAGKSGSSTAYVARLATHGTLDTTFSGDGISTTTFGATGAQAVTSLLIQSDGKIVVGGREEDWYHWGLTRFNADGTLDTSFSDDGLLTSYVGDNDGLNSITVQADGKILVAGYTWNGSNNDFALARYHADGSLDTGFSEDGQLTTDFGFQDNGYSVTLPKELSQREYLKAVLGAV